MHLGLSFNLVLSLSTGKPFALLNSIRAQFNCDLWVLDMLTTVIVDGSILLYNTGVLKKTSVLTVWFSGRSYY